MPDQNPTLQTALAPPPSAVPPPASHTAVLLAALRKIKGLDVELGLAHTAHQLPLYTLLLRKFLTGQEDALARVRLATEQADWGGAERIAHTLSGVAANLGASALRHHAHLLENALRKGLRPPAINTLLLDTAQLLYNLISGLRANSRLLLDPEGLSPDTVHDPRQGQILLKRIAALLAVDDMEAVDLWEGHAILLRTLCPHADAVERAITSFEFATALQLLDRRNLPTTPAGK